MASALFDFRSFLITVLLFITTCTFVKQRAPSMLEAHKTGARGVFWKAARIGERLSPWVGAACFAMAFSVLFF